MNFKDMLHDGWDYAPDDWVTCPDCGSKPVLWIYDNGSTARCECQVIAGKAPARTESIMGVLKRTGSTAEYNRKDLKLAWEIYLLTGKFVDTIPRGSW